MVKVNLMYSVGIGYMRGMGDLEMVRVCARVQGYSEVRRYGDAVMDARGVGVYGCRRYWPLEDLEQALDLVEWLGLLVDGDDPREIVLCVVRMVKGW